MSGKKGFKFSRVHSMHVEKLLVQHWDEWVVERGLSQQQIADLINAMKLPCLADTTGITAGIISGLVKDMSAIDPRYRWPRSNGKPGTAHEARMAALEERVALLEQRLATVMGELGMRETKLPVAASAVSQKSAFPR